MDNAVKQAIEACVLCWLATADANGQPNVSPKEVFGVFDDNTLLIANIASPQSISNIKTNSKVSVSFIEIFKQKGFKLTGTARITTPDMDRFLTIRALLPLPSDSPFPLKSIIEVKIEATTPILAPSYWLFDDTSEETQIAAAMKHYGVRLTDTKNN